MSMTNVSSLNRSIEKTQIWLKELVEIGRLKDESQAYSVLRSVLHALRDRLTADEAAHLAAQLPLLIRGTYYENYKPARAPMSVRKVDDFLARIREETRDATAVEPLHALRAVAVLLHRKISSGEMDKVLQMLPAEIREIWPRSAEAAQ